MIRRENRQTGLADAFARPSKSNPSLDRVNQLVNWEPLRQKMESFYSLSGPGRPAFPAVMLFKAVLLQNWYRLSDPAAEDAIDDRRSFRRFLGLNLDEKAPDHSTIHRFRDRIAPIMAELLQMLNAQLASRKLVVKRGTIIDATLVESSGRRPEPGSSSPRDPDATWAKKRDKCYFGYKAHIGIDQGSELIRQADLTPANVHDGKRFEAMVSGDEAAVYADKGYSGGGRSRWLTARGIQDGIMFQGSKWRQLTPEERKRNSALARIRSAVEHIFGTLKRIYQYRRCRYGGLWRNRSHLFALCICYNLRRAARLQGG
jgi:IS5 family transposase